MDIPEPAMLGHGLNLQPGVFQQVFSIIDPLADNVGSNCNTGLFFEQRRQIAAVNV